MTMMGGVSVEEVRQRQDDVVARLHSIEVEMAALRRTVKQLVAALAAGATAGEHMT